ncbi:MAG: hypothetical protein QGG71_06860 [Pirellulaceae bacterium]|jgi:hypothetical protein|nr:hypothetical protein [Pirellulaceae bacterium]
MAEEIHSKVENIHAMAEQLNKYSGDQHTTAAILGVSMTAP